MVRSYLVGNCWNRGIILAMIDKHNSSADFESSSDFVANIARFSDVNLRNPVSLFFANEPEVSILKPSGKPLGVFVVNNGTDPASVLERLHVSRRDLTVRGGKTPSWRHFLLASCIPNRLAKWRRDGGLVDFVFKSAHCHY